MKSQVLLFKVAQVATVKIIKERKGITRLWLKGGIEVKVRGTESEGGFGVLDTDGEMHHFSFDDLQLARETLSRWEKAPDWANELVLDDDCNLFWCDVYPEDGVVVKKARVAKGVYVSEDFEFESRPEL